MTQPFVDMAGMAPPAQPAPPLPAGNPTLPVAQQRSPSLHSCQALQVPQHPNNSSATLTSPGQVLQSPTVATQPGHQNNLQPAAPGAPQVFHYPPIAPIAKKRRLLDFYEFICTPDGKKVRLGGGNFATVWKGRCRLTGEEVAFKIIVKSDGSGTPPAEANPMHAEILKMVDHKNIIQVLELATGGDIVEKVGSDGVFTEAAAVRYCRQILTALAHCHKRGLVHCDLKCENILFSSKQPNAELKIADFGLAQVIERTGYDTAADMWSVGVLVYTWMSGVFPFYAPDKMPISSAKQRELMFAKIRECRYSEKYIENVSPQAKNFIHCLLKRNPKERWTAEQCLEHTWIVNNTSVNLPLSHNLDKLRTQREVRETEGVSHAFYSVLLNSSSTSQQTPLLVAATTAMETNELDIMGRGVAPLVTMAFSNVAQDQQQAAGMIANYLLKREYFDRLIDGGVLLALCHLSESDSVAVLNFVGLALYRIAQFRRAALARDEQTWRRVVALGNHASRLVARQAGRAICEMLKVESIRLALLDMGALKITSRLVQAIWASLAEQQVFLSFLMDPEVDIVGNVNAVVLKKDCGMGVFFLAAFILNQLSKDSLHTFGSLVVDKALTALEILARHPQALIKNPALATLCRLMAAYPARLAAASAPSLLALMEEYAGVIASERERVNAGTAGSTPSTCSGGEADTSKPAACQQEGGQGAAGGGGGKTEGVVGEKRGLEGVGGEEGAAGKRIR